MLTDDDGLREFFEGISFAPDHLLLDWTARLKTGDPDADTDALARAVIRDFCLRHFMNAPQSSITLGWLSEALSEILEHADPLSVLGLMPRAKHRPADPQLAMDVAWWVKLAIARGYLKADAMQRASDLFARDVKTIERYSAKGKEWANGMNPTVDWERYFLSRARPLPAPRRQDKKSGVPVPTRRKR